MYKIEDKLKMPEDKFKTDESFEKGSSNDETNSPLAIEKRFQALVNEWCDFQKRAGLSLNGKKDSILDNLDFMYEEEDVPQESCEIGACSSHRITDSPVDFPPDESHDVFEDNYELPCTPKQKYRSREDMSNCTSGDSETVADVNCESPHSSRGSVEDVFSNMSSEPRYPDPCELSSRSNVDAIPRSVPSEALADDDAYEFPTARESIVDMVSHRSLGTVSQDNHELRRTSLEDDCPISPDYKYTVSNMSPEDSNEDASQKKLCRSIEERCANARTSRGMEEHRKALNTVRFDTCESRFDTCESRFDPCESRFNTCDSRFDTCESQFDSCDTPPQLEEMNYSLSCDNEVCEEKTADQDDSAENSWTDLCKMLSDIEMSPKNSEEQESCTSSTTDRDEQQRYAEKRLLEEQKKLTEARNSLAKYEDALSVREILLQKQEQAVAENERAAAASLVEMQKRAAEIAMESSLVQEKIQQLDSIEKQVKNTMMDLQTETEVLNKRKQEIHEHELRICAREKALEEKSQKLDEMEDRINRTRIDLELETEMLNKKKLDLQEQDMQIRAKEKALEVQLCQCTEEMEKLKAEWEKIEDEKKIESNEKDFVKVKEEKLAAKEEKLRCIEKDIEGKCFAFENLARKLNAREKLLKNIQKQNEEERCQLDADKKAIQEAKKDFECSRKDVDEARKKLCFDKDETFKNIKSFEEKIKSLELRVKEQNDELAHKQVCLEKLEVEIKNEQQRYHALNSKIHKEHQKLDEEFALQEESLSKREAIVEKKEEDVKKSLQKLIEKKTILDAKLRQLKEIESRTDSLEDELHKRHQEHVQKVEQHAKDYQNQLEHLETVKHDLQQKNVDIDRRFQEVQALKKEVKAFQKKSEKEIACKMEAFLKEKEDFESQKQNLKNLQHEVEKAGAKLVNYMMNLEQASSKLNIEKLDASQKKLQIVQKHLRAQFQHLKEREKCLMTKGQQLDTLSKEWERKSADIMAKEEELKTKQQTLKSREENERQLKIENLIRLRNAYKELRDSPPTSPDSSCKGMELIQALLPGNDQQNRRKENGRMDDQGETLNLDMLQHEFARIIKERENLKVQQHELEETKNEVQDAKMTLAAQLRATKEMVVDASITAQKASREREALEQERRRLGKAQKEIEAALSAREAKLSMEEKRLEKEKHFLEEERERAMDIIYKAEQMRKLADSTETNSSKSSHTEQSHPTPVKPVHGLPSRLSFNDHSVPSYNNSPIPMPPQKSVPRMDLDMISLWREKECAKIEREEKMIMDEISRLHSQHQDENYPPSGSATDRYHMFHRNLGPSLEALHIPTQESCDMQQMDFYRPVSEEPMDGFLSESENVFRKETKQQQDHDGASTIAESCDGYYDTAVAKNNRLENVMQSLLNARQASRSRLQRTRNLIQQLPISGGYILSELQQGLETLADRLSLMEQMEDELTDELRDAYRMECPDSEGILVDKVELLSKMEEQQALRAEWEDDMQSHLEKISILQSNSQPSSNFSTPVKRTVFDRIISPPATNQSSR